MKIKFPKRQDSGTRGTRGAINTNHFEQKGEYRDINKIRGRKEPDPDTASLELLDNSEVKEDQHEVGDGYYDVDERSTVYSTEENEEVESASEIDELHAEALKQQAQELEDGESHPKWMYRHPAR